MVWVYEQVLDFKIIFIGVQLIYKGFLADSLIKNPPAMQETQIRSLAQKYPLEKEMSTHSSILDWRIPWTGEPGGLQSMGSQRVGHDSDLSLGKHPVAWKPVLFCASYMRMW